MNKEKMKSVPGGVLGIVGGAVMLVGAFILIYAVVTIAELLEEGSVALTDEGIFGRSVAGIFTYLISGALGLSGGIIAIRKDNKLGAILIFIAAVMALVTGILAEAPLAYVMTGLFVVAGLIALFVKKSIVPQGYYPPYHGGYPPYGGNGSPYGDGYPPYGGSPYNGNVPPPRFDPQTGKPINDPGNDPDPFADENKDR